MQLNCPVFIPYKGKDHEKFETHIISNADDS